MAEGEGAQSGADEGVQSGTGGTTTDDSGTAGTTVETGTQSGAPSEAEKLAESYREKMRAADQRAAKFETELKQLREKDLPEAEKQAKQLSEAQATVDKLTETNKSLALKVAFLSDNSVTWHNPERALKLVDLSNVTIDEDGTVTGLKDALTALSKSDAYLVKTDTSAEEIKPPGTAPGNNGSNGTGGTKRGALESRLPVLRTRVR
jgi:hypothetical protein